jgi:hypothetical protein
VTLTLSIYLKPAQKAVVFINDNKHARLVNEFVTASDHNTFKTIRLKVSRVLLLSWHFVLPQPKGIKCVKGLA